MCHCPLCLDRLNEPERSLGPLSSFQAVALSPTQFLLAPSISLPDFLSRSPTTSCPQLSVKTFQSQNQWERSTWPNLACVLDAQESPMCN